MSSKIYFENLFKESKEEPKNYDSDFDKLKKEFNKIRNRLGEKNFKDILTNHISNN